MGKILSAYGDGTTERIDLKICTTIGTEFNFCLRSFKGLKLRPFAYNFGSGEAGDICW